MSAKHCFISHAWGENEKGHAFAVHLKQELEKRRIRCAIDDEQLLPGDKIAPATRQAVANCPVFLAVLCRSYHARPHCMEELNEAVGLDKPSITVIREQCDDGNVPEALRNPESLRLDMSTHLAFEAGLSRLVEAIKKKSPPDESPPPLPLHWRLGALLGCAILLGFVRWPRRDHLPPPAPPLTIPTPKAVTSPQTLSQTPVPYPEEPQRIISPPSDEPVKYSANTGQGGRVQVVGQSRGLAPDQVILLTVTPEHDHERPQTPANPLRPDTDGKWNQTVQVGDDLFSPTVGQKYTVKVYLVPQSLYSELRAAAVPGGAPWPLPGRAKPNPVAERTFTLGQQQP
jgi:hypothetical protein